MMKTQAKSNGYVLFEGPSLIDGGPIAVIVTGTNGRGSSNIKTGAMLQTWIIRTDTDPITANRQGLDTSICGRCPLKGEPVPGKVSGLAANRGCYVQIGQAPAAVYKAYKAGKYPLAIVYAGLFFPPNVAATGGQCIGFGEMVRLGSYGDPAAVPGHVWDRLTKFAKGWTGYTHQINTAKADARPDIMMISADSEHEAKEAWRKGYRTFRIVADTSQVIKGSEIVCPATTEGGNKATCSTCGLCKGAVSGGKSVAVVSHGAGKKHALQAIAQ
jgi:hypothetical protein